MTSELLGAYRFDDPEGEVGIEGHLVRLGDVVLHAPLTYRAAPLAGAEDALVTQMQHSALGTRWIYDGCADAAFLRMLAVMALTGVGQSAQVVLGDSVVETAAPSVRLVGTAGLTTGSRSLPSAQRRTPTTAWPR